MSRMSFKPVPLVVIAAALTVTAAAEGKAKLECNKKQTRCMTESLQLTIGDQVGIFNEEGELVATGEVMAMRGERRAVKIERRHGKIRRGDTLALLETNTRSDASSGSTSMYKVYREPAELSVGASVGYGSVSIGDQSPASEISAYGEYRSILGMKLVGRFVYEAIEGTVTRYGEREGLESAPISVSGIGLLGGVGYAVRENQLVGFHGELAAGGMNIDAKVDGQASLVKSESGYRTHIANGLAPYGRGVLGLKFNFSAWHMTTDAVWSIVHEAHSQLLVLGLVKDLK